MKWRWMTILILGATVSSYAQKELIDPYHKNLFDSLSNRIQQIEKQIPQLKQKRSHLLYFTQQELEKTRFLSAFEEYIFNEDLNEAQALAQVKKATAIKRNDEELIAFYSMYESRLIQEIQSQRDRYNQLFRKEKNFQKELNQFIKIGDEYSLLRAKRMVELAMKYALENQLNEVIGYLPNYAGIVEAEMYDFHSDFNLLQLANYKHQFDKQIKPLIESDSLSDILEAKDIVDNCYRYASFGTTKLDTNFFALQKNVVSKSISDYYARIGMQNNLSQYNSQSVIARRDSLNNAGVYRWNEFIVVIGEFTPQAGFENVKCGEAILDADYKLFEYIRINRLARLNKIFDVGTTEIIPYLTENGPRAMQYNHEQKKWQYMICYTRIKSQSLTQKVNAYLPPLQFEEEIEDAEMLN